MVSRWSKYFMGNRSFEIIKNIFDELEVWDAHTHIGVDADGKKLSARQLVAAMNRAGVSKAVAFPLNDPERGRSFHKPNDRIFRAYRRYPEKIVPFFRLDPNGSWEKEFHLRVSQGFRGIKLHPRSQRFDITSNSAMEIYEKAEDENLVVLVHTGMGVDNIVSGICRVYRKFSNLRLILAHGAFLEIQEATKLLKGRDTLAFEMSATLPFDVYDIMQGFPADQIFYGSDIPYFDMEYYMETIVHISVILNTRMKDLQKIFSGNLRRWLYA